jgi:hypothetical protein
MRNASALAETLVQDPDGRTLGLGTLWRRRPLVLVFIRHFG